MSDDTPTLSIPDPCTRPLTHERDMTSEIAKQIAEDLYKCVSALVGAYAAKHGVLHPETGEPIMPLNAVLTGLGAALGQVVSMAPTEARADLIAQVLTGLVAGSSGTVMLGSINEHGEVEVPAPPKPVVVN